MQVASTLTIGQPATCCSVLLNKPAFLGKKRMRGREKEDRLAH